MDLRYWSALERGASRDEGADELQTDVMRFMAILGFCLMAIFAIVQGLPTAPPDRRPELTHAQSLREEIRRLEQQAAGLRQQTARLLLELRTTEATQAAVAARLATTRTDHAGLAREVEALRERLVKQQQRLRELGVEQSMRHRSLTELRRATIAERARLDEAAAHMHALAQGTPPAVNADSEAASAATPAETPEQDGFTLRFASDAALLGLLQSGRVTLHAIVHGRAWAFRTDGDRLTLVESAAPPRHHEMDAATVPDQLARLFRERTSVLDPHRVTWGVMLPPALRDQITELMQRHRGGNLVIGSDGRVTREAG